MDVFVVWKGHRDSEADVAVCETRELAEQFLAENDVRIRRDSFYNCDELMDAGETPWGIVEVRFVRTASDLFEVEA